MGDETGNGQSGTRTRTNGTKRNKSSWTDLDEGFVMIPTLLFKLGLSAYARLVYATLRSHANDVQVCWPSYSVLMRETGLCRGRIAAAVRELSVYDPPLIAHTVDRSKHNGNIYTVYPVVSGQDDAAVLTRDRGSLDPGLSQSSPATETISNNHIHKAKKTGSHVYDPEFLKVWDEYPRGSEKIIAEKCCLSRVRGGSTWAELTAAARHYARSVSGTEKRYIKLAKTFFGPNRPFEDWIVGDPNAEVSEADLAFEQAEKAIAEQGVEQT